MSNHRKVARGPVSYTSLTLNFLNKDLVQIKSSFEDLKKGLSVRFSQRIIFMRPLSVKVEEFIEEDFLTRLECVSPAAIRGIKIFF